MTTANAAQGFGFDAWIQPFREAMAAFAPAAMPDKSWPGMGAWASQMPGMAQSVKSGFEPGVFPSGAFAPGAAGPFAGMLEQISAMAQGQWQQLAAQLSTGAMTGAMSGGDAMAPWRNLFQTMLPTADTFDSALRHGMNAAAVRDALSTPPVGPLREHVERWQQAMLAQLDYQEASQAFSAQLGEIMRLAMGNFERRLAARGEAGQPPASMRALFDEWIEAGEEAWAERAGGDAFVAALGRYTNAQIRVRAAMADQTNRMVKSLGLPTRDEVDADHRRIAMLERELRRLRGELDDLRRVPTAVADKDEVRKARVVPLRPEGTTSIKNAAPAEVAPSHAKAGKKGKAEKSTKQPGKRIKAARMERSPVSATVLPIVAAPRAIGVADKRDDAAAPRRRVGK